jgi:hypothetical protein
VPKDLRPIPSLSLNLSLILTLILTLTPTPTLTIRRYGVRPALLDSHDHAYAAATVQWERRCLQRFSLLYAKYTPQRYWYEAVELP